MHKGKLVTDLTPGSSFTQSLFMATSQDIKQGKNGSTYAMFTIEDRSGSAAAKYWNIPPDTAKHLLEGSFFLMSGSVEGAGQYSGQVTVSHLKPVSESDVNMDDFLTPFMDDHPFHWDRFTNLVKSVKDPHLKALLRSVFNESDTLQRFKNAVAAKSMHHSHRGGLVEHSGEVAVMCDKMCEVLPGLNRDLVVTCALLHDIGKLEEMEHGVKHGEYTADGALIGHIILGTEIIQSAMPPDFPPTLRKMVMHLILSHHGTLEFGSPKTPSTAEAHVLAACDVLSAKAFQQRNAVKNARAGQVNVKLSDGWAYVGKCTDDEILSGNSVKLQSVEQTRLFDSEAVISEL